jgi:uncharacterized protein YegL
MTEHFDAVEFDPNNPEPRCPCVLLVDTSSSMRGAPIDALNEGLRLFQESLQEDETTLLRVEVALISFGGDADLVTGGFIPANDFTAPELVAQGLTPMGQALIDALAYIEERKQIYKEHGIPYYRPWMFLITDGEPTDGELWKEAAAQVHEAVESKRLAFFAVGVEGANFAVLEQISPRSPKRLSELRFQEMFLWLSSSLRSVSHSTPGDAVPLKDSGDWSEV